MSLKQHDVPDIFLFFNETFVFTVIYSIICALKYIVVLEAITVGTPACIASESPQASK